MDKPMEKNDAGYTLPREKSLPAKASARDLFLALLPLLVWGAAWIYAAAEDIFPSMSHPGRAVQGFLVAHAVTLLGLGVGWWLRFPRWSYLSAGLAVTFSAYWAGLAMNGWRVLGMYFFEAHSSWSWRAWVPLLVLALIMLGLTRSLRPVKQFLVGMWADWSTLSLALYGWLVFLFMTIHLDSIELAYEFLQPVFMVLAFLGGVILYMRASNPWKRALGLDAGLFVGVLGVFGLGWIFYPEINHFISLDDVPLQAAYILLLVGWVLIWLGLVFLPALLGLWRRPRKT